MSPVTIYVVAYTNYGELDDVEVFSTREAADAVASETNDHPVSYAPGVPSRLRATVMERTVDEAAAPSVKEGPAGPGEAST